MTHHHKPASPAPQRPSRSTGTDTAHLAPFAVPRPDIDAAMIRDLALQREHVTVAVDNAGFRRPQRSRAFERQHLRKTQRRCASLRSAWLRMAMPWSFNAGISCSL